jgi:hypothetical protein
VRRETVHAELTDLEPFEEDRQKLGFDHSAFSSPSLRRKLRGFDGGREFREDRKGLGDGPRQHAPP